MATTTNYGWTTPDDTALVKDGAAAIRSLGTAIDTSFAADEGDLLVGGTSDIFEALPIGAAGTVLTSDGDTAEWAAPGGGANYTLLNAGGTALTGAGTITVSGISGKNDVFVVILGASSASAFSTISVRINSDSGTNYQTAGFRIYANNTYSTNNFEHFSFLTEQINIGGMSNNAGSTVAGSIRIDGCNSTGEKVFTSVGSGNPSGSNGQAIYSLQGFWDNAATVSSISVLSDTGNFDAGTVYVYTSA
jgi:hypothetical protein